MMKSYNNLMDADGEKTAALKGDVPFFRLKYEKIFNAGGLES